MLIMKYISTFQILQESRRNLFRVICFICLIRIKQVTNSVIILRERVSEHHFCLLMFMWFVQGRAKECSNENACS